MLILFSLFPPPLSLPTPPFTSFLHLLFSLLHFRAFLCPFIPLFGLVWVWFKPFDPRKDAKIAACWWGGDVFRFAVFSLSIPFCSLLLFLLLLLLLGVFLGPILGSFPSVYKRFCSLFVVFSRCKLAASFWGGFVSFLALIPLAPRLAACLLWQRETFETMDVYSSGSPFLFMMMISYWNKKKK